MRMNTLIPDKESTPLGNYHIIKESDLPDFINTLFKSDIISIDLETTGLDVYTDSIVGISLSVKPQEAFYLPLSHTVGVNLSKSRVLSFLKPILEDKHCIGHNIKFDYKFLVRENINPNINLNIYSDTMLLSHLDDVNQSLSLKSLALKYLNIKMIHFEDLFFRTKKSSRPNISDLSPEEVYQYSCADADMCLRLYHHFTNNTQLLHHPLYDLEMNLIKLIAHMELNGIYVDRTSLESHISDINNSITRCKSKITDIVGYNIELNSNQQVSDLLYNRLNLPYKGSITKSSVPSVSTLVLNRIEDTHPIVKSIIEYRTLLKQKGMLEGYLSSINPITNAIHTSFLQWHVPSGRFASANPNLQNVPEDLRKHFIARKGYIFVNFDFSQIEYRVIASMSNETALIKSFYEDKDIHRQTASMLFNIPYNEVSDDQRKRGKTINFALLYGMDYYGLSDRLKIDRSSAKKLLEDYFNAVPNIKSFIDKTHQQVQEQGYVETYFGCRRYIPEVYSFDFKVKSYGLRSAISHCIQGTSADILKLAMLNIEKKFNLVQSYDNVDNTPFGATPINLILTVHDSLLFEVREDVHISDFISSVIDCMSIKIPNFCPLSVSYSSGKSWVEL